MYGVWIVKLEGLAAGTTDVMIKTETDRERSFQAMDFVIDALASHFDETCEELTFAGYHFVQIY